MSFALRLMNEGPRNTFGFPRGWDRWFDDMFSTFGSISETFESGPSCEVQETEGHYLLIIDMPGVSKENVNVEVDGNLLKVSGERKDERKESKNVYHFQEKRYGKFERYFRIPEDVDVNKIEANHENGVLRIALEKGEVSKPQKIEIQDSNKGLFAKLLKG